jgi:hypothetical protein
MDERRTPFERIRSVAYVLRMAAVALADRIDTRYADAINGPDDFPYPRIYTDHVEAPALTEADLEAGDAA